MFRLFIENISGEGKPGKQLHIDRTFYEEMIARIILFRSLEKLHGSGSDAIGQLRSAVVPYSISILYKYSTGDASNYPFKLTEIWKKEGLDEQLMKVMRNLMTLMNKLIKKYAESDDFGEYSKKPELWNKIRTCSEIRQFVNSESFSRIIKRFCKPAANKAEGNLLKHEIDFGTLYNSVDFFSESKRENSKLRKAVDFVVNHYNKAIGNGDSIQNTFSAIRKMAAKQGADDAIVFSKIGKMLSEGTLPEIEHIQRVANYTES